jgi:sulfate adenylyltransferase subunit 2
MQAHLQALENESVYIIREAYSQLGEVALLWSMGKDSTVLLHLIRKAFFGNVPFPLLHIDTSYKIKEMIEWRDQYVRTNELRLIIGQNTEALAAGMGPDQGRLTCCGSLKTKALVDTVKEHKLHGLFLGIRHDEEGSRGKERVVSPRADDSTWSYKDQPAEIWSYHNLHVPSNIHVRVHPILRWTELDVWQYIAEEKLEVIPLYFSKGGTRYRSLGCAPCTATVQSDASNAWEIIDELKRSGTSERAGRAQDAEHTYAMQKLRSNGYM